MTPKNLPRELIPLIHHIELNKAGWWDRAIQQSIMFLIWLNDNRPMWLQEVVDNLRTVLKIRLDTYKIQQQINCLGNRIIQTGNGFKLSENDFLKFQGQMDEVERIENTVKTLFMNLVNELCPSLGALKVWSDFNDEFLVPFVKEMGAYVFHLVTTGTQVPRMEEPAKDYLSKCTSKYPAANIQLKEVVARFLNLKDHSVRQYILRTLNMYYYVAACGLTTDTLQRLSHIAQSKPSFNIFIDTNFLFSILDLHDNPSNEAATALMTLSERLSPNVTVRFYVTLITIQEAQKVLISVKSSLQGVRPTQNLLQSLKQVAISRIALKYLNACKDNPSLDAETFFRPYIDNLLSIARQSGIELYNARLQSIRPNKRSSTT